MISNKAFFIWYVKFDGGMVSFGDGVQRSIVGNGAYQKDGMVVIQDVYHVVNFKVNLLRVSYMCDNFPCVVFKHEICQFKDNDENHVMIGRKDFNNINVMFSSLIK